MHGIIHRCAAVRLKRVDHHTAVLNRVGGLARDFAPCWTNRAQTHLVARRHSRVVRLTGTQTRNDVLKHSSVQARRLKRKLLSLKEAVVSAVVVVRRIPLHSVVRDGGTVVVRQRPVHLERGARASNQVHRHITRGIGHSARDLGDGL